LESCIAARRSAIAAGPKYLNQNRLNHETRKKRFVLCAKAHAKRAGVFNEIRYLDRENFRRRRYRGRQERPPDSQRLFWRGQMKVLLMGEESQITTKLLRARGHEAFSCDLKPCSGGRPDWHIQGDVYEILSLDWDMMIAHPPCTFIAASGQRWLSHPDDSGLPFDDRRPHPSYPNRRADRDAAIRFALSLYYSPIPKVCIENPIGALSTIWRKPDQIVHPWMFGDAASKATCLWLKGLPKLEPTNIVDKGEYVYLKNGKREQKWIYDARWDKKRTQEIRSKTFPGMAAAFASQWG